MDNEVPAACAICQETLGGVHLLAWPSCEGVSHVFHTACLGRVVQVARGLAHFAAHGEFSILSRAFCPLCNAVWGDSAVSSDCATVLLASLEAQGIDPQTRGCLCRGCVSAGAGPSAEEASAAAEALLYRGRTVGAACGEPVAHAVVYCPCHPDCRLIWETSRTTHGWRGFWICPRSRAGQWVSVGDDLEQELLSCAVSVGAADVPVPPNPPPSQCLCGGLGTLSWVARWGGAVVGPGCAHWSRGQWDCRWACASCVTAASRLPPTSVVPFSAGPPSVGGVLGHAASPDPPSRGPLSPVSSSRTGSAGPLSAAARVLRPPPGDGVMSASVSPFFVRGPLCRFT